MENKDSSSDYVPSDIIVEAETAIQDLICTKSKNRYEKAYKEFWEWCNENQVKKVLEVVVLA